MFDLAVIFGLGVPELIIILVIVLVLLGPAVIPKLGKAIGETIKTLRYASKETKKGSNTKETEPAKQEKTKEIIGD